MFTIESLFWMLGMTTVAAPGLLVVVLGVPTLLGKPLSERATGRLVEAATVLGLACSLAILGLMLVLGERNVPIAPVSWVHIPDYHFVLKFVFDRLSVPFVILSFLLCGTVGAFANKYMHREEGFNRLFVFYAIFLFGMVMTSLAGTIETLFAGWEFVGLSSTLLVAFYQDRQGPVRNGLHVWTVYRVSDAALLIAAVAMHDLVGEGEFAQMFAGNWPEGTSLLTGWQALAVGSLLLIAAMGKSGLVPFSGWLPRAMEGPTPSSAVFYGALSVHLGAFLLLRASPILDMSPLLCVMIVAVGVVTACFGVFATRVQTDIKSALAFASVTQVGIITAEIGLGLRYIPLVHILGHACLRTMQFLRAPSVLHDYRSMENAIGDHLPAMSSIWQRILPERTQIWLYRLAMERGYMDDALIEFVVGPFLWFFNQCDKWERRWVGFLQGKPIAEQPPKQTAAMPLEELV